MSFQEEITSTEKNGAYIVTVCITDPSYIFGNKLNLGHSIFPGPGFSRGTMSHVILTNHVRAKIFADEI